MGVDKIGWGGGGGGYSSSPLGTGSSQGTCTPGFFRVHVICISTLRSTLVQSESESLGLFLISLACSVLAGEN